MNKQCNKCKIIKPVEDYSKLRSTCKKCIAEAARLYRKENKEEYKKHYTKWRRKNPEKMKAAYKKKKLAQYNLTESDYNRILLEQNNVCACCGQKETTFDSRLNVLRTLAVDHDHLTGEVRGLLCTNCNNGLGRFKDNISLLQNAIDYLNKYNQKRKCRI